MFASRLARMGRHWSTDARVLTRAFSQGGVPHRGSGKVKPGRDKKGNRVAPSSVSEASEDLEGEQVEKGVGAVPQPDWDSVGEASEDDEGASSGRLPKARGRRKRPVKSPSFHSRGGFDDLDGQTREEAIEDGLGLNSLEAEFDDELDLKKEDTTANKRKPSGKTEASHSGSGTSLHDDEVNVEPVLDTPEAIAIFTELEARVRKFQLQQAGGDEKGEDSGNDQEGPAASPESDDVDEGGIDEGDVEEMGTAKDQNSVPAVKAASLFSESEPFKLSEAASR